MKNLWYFLLLFALPFNIFAQQKSCREVLGVAESFLIDGNTDNVRKILNQTRITCGNDISWYYVQYGYQTSMGQLDSVLHFSALACKKYSDNDSMHLLYAQAILETMDSAEAIKGIEIINKAIKIKKRSSYLLCKAQLQRTANQIDDALKTLTSITSISKNYAALIEYGVLLTAQNNPKEALKKFNAAKKLDLYHPASYLQKADLYFYYLNNQDAALAALDSVEMIDSTLADPFLMRAAYFESVNDFDNAISEYDMAIQSDSSVHQVYLFRGTCLKEIKEFDLAETDYKTYKEKHPDEGEINYMLADLYIAKGDFNAAALLMSQMETKGNSEYELYLMRGIAYNNNGQYEDALKDFNKAENYKERDVDLYYNRGLCYFNKEEYRKAKYDFEKAKSMMPDNMEFWYLHCRAAYHAGHYDEACQSCKMAKFHNYEGMDNTYIKNCND